MITVTGKTVFYPSDTKSRSEDILLSGPSIFTFLHLGYAELQYSNLSKVYSICESPDCVLWAKKNKVLSLSQEYCIPWIFSLHGLMQGYCK